MKQLLITMGWLIVFSLFVLMVIGIWPTKAHADGFAAYDLVMASYPSDRGHSLSWRTYTDVFRAPYPTEEACEAARDYVLAKHKERENPKTMAMQLAEVFCIKNPGGNP